MEFRNTKSFRNESVPTFSSDAQRVWACGDGPTSQNLDASEASSATSPQKQPAHAGVNAVSLIFLDR